MTAIWDDISVLWDDTSWTWDGQPLAAPCARTPEVMSGATLTTILTAPSWPGNMALVLAVETFAVPSTVGVAVYPSRSIDACPPVGVDPIAAWTATLPAGVVLEIDGAREEVRLVDKARKAWRPGLPFIDPVGGIHQWPTFGGPCRDVCVAFTGGVDDVEARVYTVTREL